jgi:SAM-dependent methyltransferase
MTVDFGKTASDYGKFRAGFPDEFFKRLHTYGLGAAGQRVLDLGTGTGTVARGLALRGCRVTGLDRCDVLIAEARRLDTEAGVAVAYVTATAEATGLQSSSFDVVTAGQCWHWFDAPAAAREALRVLVPAGLLVIGHFDWIPLPSNVVAVTERLIEQYNPAWKMGGMNGTHGDYLADISLAGFRDLETFSFDIDTPYTQEGWRGRIRASAGVGASLPPARVAAFDAELDRILKTDFPGDPLRVPHRVWALIAKAPA